MLSGVRSQIAIKIFGEDLDTLRGQADALRAQAGGHPGHRRPRDREAGAGAADQGAHRLRGRGAVWRCRRRRCWRRCKAWSKARSVTQIVEGGRRFALVVKLPESARSAEGPAAHPDRDAVRARAAVEARVHRGGRRPEPDQPRRRQAAHRAVGQCAGPRAVRHRGRHAAASWRETKLPEGYFVTLGGQFQAQEEASRLVGLLSLGVADADVRRAVQPLPVDAAVAAHHGQHPAGAGRRGRRAVAVGPAAVGRGAGRLHHAGRHLGAQRHPQGQPLHQPDAIRRRELRPAG